MSAAEIRERRYQRTPGEDLTLKNVAETYQIPLRTVYTLFKSGQWSTFTYKIGKIYVIRAGLEDWIDAGGELSGRSARGL